VRVAPRGTAHVDGVGVSPTASDANAEPSIRRALRYLDGIVSNGLLGGIRLDSCDDSRPDDSMRLSAPRLPVTRIRRSAIEDAGVED
jgi:hypothetical protein